MISIYCIPKEISQNNLDLSQVLLISQNYLCPVYRTTERRGDLTSTSHSTNFILYIYLKIPISSNPEHWMMRGTAMVTQLDD